MANDSAGAGKQFEVMCEGWGREDISSPSINLGDEKMDTFTAVRHVVSDCEIVCVGEIDAKDERTGRYVELKLSSANPRFFNLFQRSQDEMRLFLLRACALARVGLLVRGHRDKKTNVLDILSEIDPEERGRDAGDVLDWPLLVGRLREVWERVQDGKWVIQYDDQRDCLVVEREG